MRKGEKETLYYCRTMGTTYKPYEYQNANTQHTSTRIHYIVSINILKIKFIQVVLYVRCFVSLHIILFKEMAMEHIYT